MTNELVKKEEVSLVRESGEVQILPRNFTELIRFGNMVLQSRLAPKGFDTVEKISIGLLTNMELGRPLITGLQDLAIINGRCGIYGDATMAMVLASGQMENGYPIEEETGTPFTDSWRFTYKVKRKGQPERIGVWTWIDAKRAGFDEPKTKDGRSDRWSPWARFPRRMMAWKARNWVLRDTFGDILRGMKTVEEIHDLDPVPLERMSDGSYGAKITLEREPEVDEKEMKGKLYSEISSREGRPIAAPIIDQYVDLCAKNLGLPKVKVMEKALDDIDQFFDFFIKWMKEPGPSESPAEASQDPDPEGTKESNETGEALTIDEFKNLKKAGLSKLVYAPHNRGRIQSADPEVIEALRSKWATVIPEENFPLEILLPDPADDLSATMADRINHTMAMVNEYDQDLIKEAAEALKIDPKNIKDVSTADQLLSSVVDLFQSKTPDEQF